MLFYLKYASHDVEKLHEMLAHFFQKTLESEITIFDSGDLFPEWYNLTDNRLEKVEQLLTTFLSFESGLKKQIAEAFILANQIQDLFSNISYHIPVALDFNGHIINTSPRGNYTVENFLNDLFNTQLYLYQLGKKDSTFCKKIGSNVSDQYNIFLRENVYEYSEYDVCPFCGLERMRDTNIRRPDYDHLLPKGDSLFVFSSINMKNLFPIGSDCNILKGTKYLLYSDDDRNHRTLSFYPYDSTPYPFEKYHFELICNSIPSESNLFKGEWQVDIIANDPLDAIIVTKIATWDRVFQIKDRIATRIQKNNKSWLSTKIKITDFKNVQDLSLNITQLLNIMECNYLSISTVEGIIPETLFFQWMLHNDEYLSDLVVSNSSIIADNRVLSETKLDDYE